MSTLNGTASNTSWNIFIQSTVAIPLYVLFILLPSLFLNGSTVLAFFQEVCTHTTQPPHCQSVLCGYLQQSSEWILATNCHSSCSQAWELCHYSTSNSISQLDTLWNNMLNLAAISLGMSITLKYGASCIMYKKLYQ